MPKPSNKITDSRLTKKLDKLFSLYIRQRDAQLFERIDECFNNRQEMLAKCCTCGKTEEIRNMDAGHFISRRFHNLRWDERNVHAQCKKCNMYGAGEQYLMAQYIDNKYGKGTADLLNELRFKKEAPRRLDKIAMIEKYKELVR